MGVRSPQTSQSPRPRLRGAVRAGTEAEVRQRAVRHAETARRQEVESVVSPAGSRHTCSERGFAHKACERGQVEPDIGLKDEGLDAWQAKDRHPFEPLVFKGGVA